MDKIEIEIDNVQTNQFQISRMNLKLPISLLSNRFNLYHRDRVQ